MIGYSGPALVGAQTQIQDGMVTGAEGKGWEVLTVLSGGDANKQINDIKDLIAQGVDAIVAVPDDSASICQAVEAAQGRQFPFYTIDRSPSGCEINMTILSDNYLAGQQSGEAIVAFLTERHGAPKGKVLEITGNLAQNVAQLRGGGFNDVMKEYPEITVITKVGDWDAAKGVDIVRDVASTEADLDAIYMHSDCAYGPERRPDAGRAREDRQGAAKTATSTCPASTAAWSRSTSSATARSTSRRTSRSPTSGW